MTKNSKFIMSEFYEFSEFSGTKKIFFRSLLLGNVKNLKY